MFYEHDELDEMRCFRSKTSNFSKEFSIATTAGRMLSYYIKQTNNIDGSCVDKI